MKIARDKYGAPADKALCTWCDTGKIDEKISPVWCRQCSIDRCNDAIEYGERAKRRLKEINEST